MKYFIMLIAGLIISSACTKKADIDLPKAENKLVVTCFITPEDSIISAVVRNSTPKFGTSSSSPNDQSDITDAVVNLSDGARSVSLKFDTEGAFYRINASEMPVVPGKTYYLEVSTPDGKKVTASATVPLERFEIESANFPMIRQDSTSFEHEISIVVPDIEGSSYFALFFSNTVITRQRRPQGAPTGFSNNAWSHFDSDEKTAKTKFYHTSTNSYYSSDTITSAWLDVSVLNCSRDFYLYSKSISEGGGISNPFSDPVMVYTNISNGFGCFGAYRSRSVTHVVR